MARAVAGGMIGLAVLTMSSACGQVRGHQLKAFVRERGGISVVHPALPSGEALIKIKNDSRRPARMVLARLDRGVAALPIGADSIVPMGSAADLDYRGRGYRVVVKMDDLAPFYARGQTSATMHVHLENGRYVLFSNLPGDYLSGRRVELTVGH